MPDCRTQGGSAFPLLCVSVSAHPCGGSPEEPPAPLPLTTCPASPAVSSDLAHSTSQGTANDDRLHLNPPDYPHTAKLLLYPWSGAAWRGDLPHNSPRR